MPDDHRTIHTDLDPETSEGQRDVPSDAPPKPSGPPEAPYGYTDKGEPRKGPFRPRPGRKRTKPATAARPRAKGGKFGKDHRPALAGVVQVALVPFGIAGRRNPVFLADAVAVADHSPDIIEALNDLAQDNAVLARVFERIGQVGPYGALVAALTPLVAQLGVNHGAIDLAVAEPLGARDPVEVLKAAGVEVTTANIGPDGQTIVAGPAQ